jgi:hypothetical protein
MTKNSTSLDINIGLNKKFITNVSKTKFLGRVIESTLSWSAHVQQLIPKLCLACYAIKAIKPFISQDAVRLVYVSYFPSLMTYGIIIWGNSSDSVQVFRMQKRVVRILMGSRCRDSCRELFKTLKILPIQSQYRETSEIHDKNTRSRSNLHLPLPNLSIYQRGTYCNGIKVFNNLPADIKKLSHNVKQFRLALKRFLYTKSFYSLDEYFNLTRT